MLAVIRLLASSARRLLSALVVQQRLLLQLLSAQTAQTALRRLQLQQLQSNLLYAQRKKSTVLVDFFIHIT